MSIKNSSSFNLKSKIHKAVSIALISAGFIPASHAVETNVNINNPTGTTITDDPIAVILNNGQSFTVDNDGTISGEATNNFGRGIVLNFTSEITNLTNNGTISGTAGNDTGDGIIFFNNSEITNLTNNDTISGTAGNNIARGIDLLSNSTITTLTNDGTISGEATNNFGRGIVLNFTSEITNLTNNGTISGTAGNNARGIGLFTNSEITNLTNDGTISGTAGNDNARGIGLLSNSTITNLTNTGTISGTAGNDNARGIGLLNNSTITTLTNDGTISGTAGNNIGRGIGLLSNSTITNLTNTGTISGTATNNTGDGIILFTNSETTTLTNDGTISGTAGNNFGNGILLSASNITTLTNNDTISSTAGNNIGRGIGLFSNSEITTLTNDGTISGTAGNDFGRGIEVFTSTITTLTNDGTISGSAGNDNARGIGLFSNSEITTLTNTGTITGTAVTNAFDIRVDATSNLTNFNNLQPNLTYNGRLPSNYSTIIRNLDNYGSVTFSNVVAAAGDTVYTPFAGSADAAVYIKGGTYSSVMTGMPDANLSDTVTGTLTGDGVNSVGNATWTLTENGTNVWDLSVVGNYAFIDRANTQLAFNNIASNIGEVFQNMSAGGNFAHMMTYDCNTFSNGGCASFGGRITNSGGNDQSGTLVLGKKFSDNFRLSGFIDQSIDHNSYTNIEVDPNVPLIGLTGVWNKNKDNQGLQVKVGNTYQSNDTDITRNAIGTAESAKGDTTVETQSYIAEASYKITDSITSHSPFIAVRYMKTEMDGYTETDAAAPITYQDMDEESYVAIVGVKSSKKITPDVTLNLGFGIETDLNHNDAQLQGRVIGLSAFNASAISSDPENKTRQLASIGADFNLAGGQKIGVKGNVSRITL